MNHNLGVGCSVHCLRRHGRRPAGGLPDRPDAEAGRRRERRAGRRPLPLLEDAADAGEGQPAGSEPLGAQPEGPHLEGGPPHRHQPGRPVGPRRSGRPGGAGAGPSGAGEAGPPTRISVFIPRWEGPVQVQTSRCVSARTRSSCVWSWMKPASTTC